MSLHRLLVLVFVLHLGAPGVRADDASSTPLVYLFADDEILIAPKSGSGERLLVRKRGARESLVRVRETWLPELYESVENL